MRLFLLLTVMLFAVTRVQGDDLRPAYLQLTEISPAVIEVLWKVPAQGGNQRLALNVLLDGQAEPRADVMDGFIGDAHLQRWTLPRDGGLAGLAVKIEGLVASSAEVLVRVEYLDGASTVHRLTPDAPHYSVGVAGGLREVIVAYFQLGVEHILGGLDHLLFVLVLVMLVTDLRKLVWTITAFTLAHSITLSLAALALVRVPVPPVEACIALSILFVAAEVVRSQRGVPSSTARWPWMVAFSFGLLHGLGFAAALGEIGLPPGDVPAALLFFNLGVEAGQLLFVAVILVLAWLVKVMMGGATQRWPRHLAAYGIGSMAAFWTIERTLSFWG
ncbi:HupE/UreJ family protein [Ketobacter sp.]|uniref:HupE/UreJ family protein n=1 Tax=Ketobacter sp. TaxID=2083498 RepID=UPI000F28B9F5|nr:HupE/UreJ family protein [Ketobacter sp.]RLT93979.1 MAG: HupE/UreJ family protein [Ketobacter sp.]